MGVRQTEQSTVRANTAERDSHPSTRVAAGLRRARQRAGMTLTELARRADVGKSTLSELESGTGNPSLETLWSLAIALGISASRLLDPQTTQVHLIRVGEGPTLAAAGSDYRATLLSTSLHGGRRDVYRVTAEPGRPRHSDPHMPGVVEHVILSTGRALVGPASHPEKLEPGDYLSYPGDEAHTFQALVAGTSAVLLQENT